MNIYILSACFDFMFHTNVPDTLITLWPSGVASTGIHPIPTTILIYSSCIVDFDEARHGHFDTHGLWIRSTRNSAGKKVYERPFEIILEGACTCDAYILRSRYCVPAMTYEVRRSIEVWGLRNAYEFQSPGSGAGNQLLQAIIATSI